MTALASPRVRPLLVAVVLLVLGALLGVLWASVIPYAELTVTDTTAGMPPSESALLFSGPAIFALMAFAFGAVCGLAVWFVLRPARGVSGLLFAVGLALVASGIAIQVGGAVADARAGDIDPHTPGTYQLVDSLWLTGAGWNALSAPWLLLICAPGVAALVYFVCAAGSSDNAWLPKGQSSDGIDGADGFPEPAPDMPQPPADWSYPGARA
ncbi:DUF2567 domain-containing protein [Gordonia alkaliphila]|uniref:DUF2567 domain-containing protein n=1 Tax=Gordonia alkaliphila TaxID=1053547 RepID=UPI001FF5E819|nr:DUF2567 domain-containing protein [Gordonia alkaliphila]MCK0440914.1 DUF2567 domain-containing protein [Gordonia alkaliphila]